MLLLSHSFTVVISISKLYFAIYFYGLIICEFEDKIRWSPFLFFGRGGGGREAHVKVVLKMFSVQNNCTSISPSLYLMHSP